jgi:exodeoxyribonuclease VII large subunit
MLRQRLDDLAQRLRPLPVRTVASLRDKTAALAGKLDSLSPLRVLERGYSVTRRAEDGALVDSVAKVKTGDRLVTRVADGEIESTVR